TLPFPSEIDALTSPDALQIDEQRRLVLPPGFAPAQEVPGAVQLDFLRATGNPVHFHRQFLARRAAFARRPHATWITEGTGVLVGSFAIEGRTLAHAGGP